MQREAALAKVRALSEAGGTVADAEDIDHVIDLQVGGGHDASNLKPLDVAINRSLGSQIASQLDGFAVSQAVPSVASCGADALLPAAAVLEELSRQLSPHDFKAQYTVV